MDPSKYFSGRVLRTLDSLGNPVPESARVLDFGCGSGNKLMEFIERGHDGFGCDFDFREGPADPALLSNGRLRLIERNPYRLPFEDQAFDLVYSDQVFEHVQNYVVAMREIARVLRPGGQALHVFPSRGRLLEVHVRIPLAGMIRAWWWLTPWVALGFRSANRKHLSVGETVSQSAEYLRECTNYLGRKEIQAHADAAFAETAFVEKHFFPTSCQSSWIRAAGRLPGMEYLLGECFERVLYTRKA